MKKSLILLFLLVAQFSFAGTSDSAGFSFYAQKNITSNQPYTVVIENLYEPEENKFVEIKGNERIPIDVRDFYNKDLYIDLFKIVIKIPEGYSKDKINLTIQLQMFNSTKIDIREKKYTTYYPRDTWGGEDYHDPTRETKSAYADSWEPISELDVKRTFSYIYTYEIESYTLTYGIKTSDTGILNSNFGKDILTVTVRCEAD